MVTKTEEVLRGCLVLAAVALPVLGRTKNALAVQAVALRLQGTVVDGFRLFDLAVAPVADLLRGGKADFDRIENVVFHETNPSLISCCLDDTGGFLIQSTSLSPAAARGQGQQTCVFVLIRNLLRRKKREPRCQSYRPPARKDHRSQHRRP